MLAYKIQTLGNYPEESIQQQRESLCIVTLNKGLNTEYQTTDHNHKYDTPSLLSYRSEH
jgi:hypothetical protein